jgi:hypothetical protein
MSSAAPYTATLGPDVYNNGRGRARPLSVGRNTLAAAPFASLDVRASREFKIGGPKSERAITLGVDAFNVTNRVNYSTFVGTVGSPLFRQPVSAGAPRQFQLSLRATF